MRCAIGESVSQIGGGRIKVEDEIDFAVGFQCEVKIGDQVQTGERDWRYLLPESSAG